MGSSTTALDTPVEYLKGVGPQRAILLRQELEIATFGDLLNHFPYRYFDRTKVIPIAQLEPDMDYVQVAGTLINIMEEGEGRKRRLVATLYDQSGKMELLWFQGAQHQKRVLRDRSNYVAFGRLNHFNGGFSIAHPEMEAANAENTAAGMQPVYSTTQKLVMKGITNRSFAKLTSALFQQLNVEAVQEILPKDLLEQYQLCPRATAYRWIHFPGTDEQLQAAVHRLKWEELFLTQLSIARVRQQRIAQQGFVFHKVGEHFNAFFAKHMPFNLTGAQKRVLREIRQDTLGTMQMNRLLQGDVGSGKTIVAVMTMLLAWDNGFQACIMAPTEILARQHFQSFSALLSPMGLPVALLTGSVKGKERREILKGLADGSLPFVVGTHALIEDAVKFKNLGVAVIDEQHRFGVGQRSACGQKRACAACARHDCHAYSPHFSNDHVRRPGRIRN